MIETILFTVFGMATLAAVVALLRRPATIRFQDAQTKPIDHLAARHCRYFPQMHQALSQSDERYLRGRAPAGVIKEWRIARRRAMQQFLNGLFEDYGQLELMAREVSRLAPQLDNLREAELFWMGVRFRLVYRLALLELNLGHRPVKNFMLLTDIVGGLGSNVERLASRLAEDAALRRPSPLTF